MGVNAQSQNKKWKSWEAEADTLMNHEQFDGAIKLYSRIIGDTHHKNEPNYPVFYKRAVCYYSLGNFESALGDLNNIIPGSPLAKEGLILRAIVYRQSGDLNHQIEDLNRILADQPLNSALLTWRAAAYLDKGDYYPALQDLRLSRTIQENAETEVYLGLAHYYTGQPDSALTSLNKAIELEPSSLTPYLYAGSFCLQENEFALALKYLDVALRIDAKNPGVLFYRGVALVELEHEKEGCSCLAKALEAGEDDAVDYLKEYCYGVED